MALSKKDFDYFDKIEKEGIEVKSIIDELMEDEVNFRQQKDDNLESDMWDYDLMQLLFMEVQVEAMFKKVEESEEMDELFKLMVYLGREAFTEKVADTLAERFERYQEIKKNSG